MATKTDINDETSTVETTDEITETVDEIVDGNENDTDETESQRKPTAVELATANLERIESERETALVAVRLAAIDDSVIEILNQYILDNPESDFVTNLKSTHVDKRIDIMLNSKTTEFEIGQVVVTNRVTSPSVRTNENGSNETAKRAKTWFISITRDGKRTDIPMRGDYANDVNGFDAVLKNSYGFDKSMASMSTNTKQKWLDSNGFTYEIGSA